MQAYIYIFENQSSWQKYAVAALDVDLAWLKLEKDLRDTSAGEDYNIHSWKLILTDVEGVYPI